MRFFTNCVHWQRLEGSMERLEWFQTPPVMPMVELFLKATRQDIVDLCYGVVTVGLQQTESGIIDRCRPSFRLLQNSRPLLKRFHAAFRCLV